MKKLKDFIKDKKTEKKDEPLVATTNPTVTEAQNQNHGQQIDPPMVLIMRRKSIRSFPNGKRVAMYYVDRINKYVTVPYEEFMWSAGMAEEIETQNEPEVEQIEETVMHHLNDIVTNKSAKRIKFKDGSSAKVDMQTAHAILNVHNAVNDENKKKLADMAHKSKGHFTRVADFAWKHNTLK